MTYERSFSCEFLVRVSWTENLGRVRAEWLQSLSSRKTDSRCIKMMISFNNTIIKQSKSMYMSFCESQRSLDHRSTLQLPYQLSASSHYTSSLSVTFLCPPRLPPRTGFYSTPGRAHACPLPGARPTRRRG